MGRRAVRRSPKVPRTRQRSACAASIRRATRHSAALEQVAVALRHAIGDPGRVEPRQAVAAEILHPEVAAGFDLQLGEVVISIHAARVASGIRSCAQGRALRRWRALPSRDVDSPARRSLGGGRALPRRRHQLHPGQSPDHRASAREAFQCVPNPRCRACSRFRTPPASSRRTRWTPLAARSTCTASGRLSVRARSSGPAEASGRPPQAADLDQRVVHEDPGCAIRHRVRHHLCRGLLSVRHSGGAVRLGRCARKSWAASMSASVRRLVAR